MANDKKPPLRDLLRDMPAKDTGKVVARPPRPPPPPQKIAQPAAEKPVAARDEFVSQDVDISELNKPEEEQKAGPVQRIPDMEIEKNVIEVLKSVLKKDQTLWEIFRGGQLSMDENRNIAIGEREIGKFMGSSVRIYFHKLWQEYAHDKLELFTKNNLFLMSSKNKCIFMVVEKKNIYLAYSDKEGGREGPLKMAI